MSFAMVYRTATLFGALLSFLLLSGCAGMQASNLREQATQLWNKDNSEQALQYYLKSLEIEPNHSEALRSVGRLYWEKPDWYLSQKYLQRALQEKDGRKSWTEADIWNNFGWLRLASREFTDAKKAFENALKLYPDRSQNKDRPWDRCGLGIAEYGLKNQKEAEEHFNYVLSREDVQESHARANFFIGRILYESNNKAQAFEKFDMAINKSRKADPYVIGMVAEFLVSSKEFSEAERYLKMAIEKTTSDIKKQNRIQNLICMYAAKGEYAEAKKISEDRKFLGVVFNSTETGLKLTEVAENCPAYQSGLRKDDIIVRFNNTDLAKAESGLLKILLSDETISNKVQATINRQGKVLEQNLWVGFSDEMLQAAAKGDSNISLQKDQTPSAKQPKTTDNVQVNQPKNKTANYVESTEAIPVSQISRTALVIGNSNYSGASLNNPVNDAVDMSNALEKLGFTVIHQNNAGKKAMEDLIDKFYSYLKKGGVGLFYFAGHGIQAQGHNYLIPVDARITSESDIKFEAVDAGRVLGKMEDAGNPVNIVVLDACRNNPYARSFRGEAMGLSRMDAPAGSLVAFATAPDSVAADGKGRNGIYTGKLLKHMTVPGLTIEQVLKNTRRDVMAETNNRQVPWESTSMTGDFFFHLSQ